MNRIDELFKRKKNRILNVYCTAGYPYLHNTLEVMNALQESGADDLLYHFKNQVSESPRSNFFLITAGDTVVTPADNMLKGITRNNLIKVAKDHFAVEERTVTVKELATAKAAFITSTTKQILPVRQIDDVAYSDFTAVRKLQQLLQQFTGL